jgi:hypothetical protein
MTRQAFNQALDRRPELKKLWIKEGKNLKKKFIQLIKENPLPKGRPKKVEKSDRLVP